MALEIEVKFLDVDHAALRTVLQRVGAQCTYPTRTMRRVIFDTVNHELEKAQARLRVRDEGNKITMTFKRHNQSDEYADESEIIVDSFEGAKKFLEALGYQSFSVQESKRETWKLDGCEVMLDEWPWVKPYIEIEGPDEAAIKRVAETLGFDWKSAQLGSVEAAYRAEYTGMREEESVTAISEIAFDAPVPRWLEERR